MVMETVQIRLTSKLVERLEEFVKKGFYPNKSEAVRDAVRRLIIEQEMEEIGEEIGEGGGDLRRMLPEHVRELKKYCY